MEAGGIDKIVSKLPPSVPYTSLTDGVGPLGIFGWMLVMAVVGMWWAKVSYSRKLELR